MRPTQALNGFLQATFRGIKAGYACNRAQAPLVLGLRMDGAATDASGAMPSAQDNKPMLFTQEMRAKAMSLHTFSQAPKQGEKRDTSANTVVDQWETTKYAPCCVCVIHVIAAPPFPPFLLHDAA